MKKDIDTLFELNESEGEKPVGGELELNVVEAKEGTLIRLSDGLVVDPEVLLSMFESVSKFEEEFGPIDEAAEKLRLLRRIEENLAPLEELEETVNRLVESAEELLSSYSENEQSESLGDYYDDKDEVGDFGLEDEEGEDEDEEEIDVSDLTVKELLVLLLQMLSSDDDSEDEADLDVDFSDLDLARLGNMKVSDLVSALKEGKLSETLGGCGCGEKKYEGTSVDSLFEVDEDTEILGMGPETANLMQGEDVEADRDQEQHEEEPEGEDEERSEEVKKAEESLENEDFGAQLFKRLLERLEK